MDQPGIEVATLFQHIFEPPVSSDEGRAGEELIKTYKRRQPGPVAHPPLESMGRCGAERRAYQ